MSGAPNNFNLSTVTSDIIQNNTDTRNMNNSATNGWYVQAFLSSLLILVIVVGNAFVIAAYSSNSRLRTTTYTFLVSLAVSDLLVGSISLPLWIYFTVDDTAMTEKAGLYDVYLSFDIFSALASIFHLTAVSLERWLAVCRPFYYQTLSVRAYFVAILGVWVSAFAIALFSWIFRGAKLDMEAFLSVYSPLLLAVGCIGPGILIAFVNFKVFEVAKSLAQALPMPGQLPDEEGSDMQQNIKTQRRTALTLAFLTVVFLISWTPFFVISTIAVFCQECLPTYTSDGGLVFFTLMKSLQYCSSAMNPLIYAFRDREIRRTFLRLLLSCKNFFRVRKNGPNARVKPCRVTPSIQNCNVVGPRVPLKSTEL